MKDDTAKVQTAIDTAAATQPQTADGSGGRLISSPILVPPGVNLSRPEGNFRFDGGAGTFFLVGLGSTLLSLITLGLAAPWAMAMYYRWQTEHTIINGRRLRFTGSGGQLFGQWIKWWLLTVVTLGIYTFWVWPRLIRWCTEKQDFS